MGTNASFGGTALLCLKDRGGSFLRKPLSSDKACAVMGGLRRAQLPTGEDKIHRTLSCTLYLEDAREQTGHG